jgi:hypothetical protein
MDRKVKNDSLCHQVLFNKPLLKAKDEYIYGFRVKVSENFTEKRLLRYIVEAIFGKCLFESLHDGSFEGEIDEIWIDKEGNEYKGYGIQTRLYCYDATVANMLNYRCDLVYAPCESEDGEDYWITAPDKYFKEKAKWDEDDHKQGRNQWMENYYRIRARWKMLSTITMNRSENLDYDIQELIKEEWRDVKVSDRDLISGCPKLIGDESDSVEKEGCLDESPF